MEKYTVNEQAAIEGGHLVEPRQPKFGFIHDELVEAKLFRSPNAFKTKTSEDIAHNIYAHLLSLQTMRYTDPGTAGLYAKQTLQYSGFDGVRPGASDLHNLLSHFNSIEDKGTMSLPTAQVKRMLKDIQGGIKITDRDRRTLMQLEKSLRIKDPNLKSMRRIIGDWPRALPSEQKVGATRLGFMLNHYARGSDLHNPYIKSVKGIAAQNAKSPYGGLKTFATVAAATIAGAVVGYNLVRKKDAIARASNVAVKKFQR
tara:strand:- start:205 stop:975 length:771 start_codon:yes stop_codon:yes gene_type:complete